MCVPVKIKDVFFGSNQTHQEATFKPASKFVQLGHVLALSWTHWLKTRNQFHQMNFNTFWKHCRSSSLVYVTKNNS